MAKALKIAGTVAVGLGVVVATGGLGIPGLAAAVGSLGISAAGFTAISGALFTGASLLSQKPGVPKSSGATVDRLQASVVLRTPRTIVVGGPTALPCDRRDA